MSMGISALLAVSVLASSITSLAAVLTGCGKITLDTEHPRESSDFRVRYLMAPGLRATEKAQRAWMLNNKPLDTSTGTRFHEKYVTADEYTLTVLNASRDDVLGELKISCGLNYAKRSNKIYVDVRYPPAGVDMEAPEVPSFRARAYTIELTCRVIDSNPECIPEWSTEGGVKAAISKQQLVFSRDGRYSRYAEQTATFRVSREDNGKRIVCSPICPAFPNFTETSSYKVQVPYKPIVVVDPSNYTEAFEGGHVTLRCGVSSIPEAEVYWVDDGSRRINNTFGCATSGQCLTLTQLSRNDSGNYSCLADNGIYPVSMETIELDVKERVTPLDLPARKTSSDAVSIGTAVGITALVMLVVVVVVVFVRRNKRQQSDKGYQPHVVESQSPIRNNSTSTTYAEHVYGNVTPKPEPHEEPAEYACVVPKSERSSTDVADITIDNKEPNQGTGDLVYIELDHTGSQRRIILDPQEEGNTEYTAIDFVKTADFTDSLYYNE